MKKLMFGKLAKREDLRTLKFAKYIKALAPPPSAFDNMKIVCDKLKISNPLKLYPMDGNDQYVDCTIAGLAHAVTTYQGLTGKKSIASTCQVLKLYKKLTGGPDTGLVELDVLNYWRKNKCLGDKIIAYTEVDPKNKTHVQQAINLFGGVYIGFNVQENAIDDFNNGITWTPGTLSGDGHAVYLIAYDQQTVTVLTWGGYIKGTWEWLFETCDEAYAIVPPELSTPELLADLNEVTK
jgi:hypothetical protein